MNTHYAAIVFSGDPASEHPDDALRGHSPSLDFIACGGAMSVQRDHFYAQGGEHAG